MMKSLPISCLLIALDHVNLHHAIKRRVIDTTCSSVKEIDNQCSFRVLITAKLLFMTTSASSFLIGKLNCDLFVIFSVQIISLPFSLKSLAFSLVSVRLLCIVMWWHWLHRDKITQSLCQAAWPLVQPWWSKTRSSNCVNCWYWHQLIFYWISILWR